MQIFEHLIPVCSRHFNDLRRNDEATEKDSIFSLGLFLIAKECSKALQLFVSIGCICPKHEQSSRSLLNKNKFASVVSQKIRGLRSVLWS